MSTDARKAAIRGVLERLAAVAEGAGLASTARSIRTERLPKLDEERFTVVVLGVAIQDKEPASLEFIQRFGLTFPNAPDPAGRVSIDYGVYGVPETFVIDRRGMIRRKHVGAMTEAVFRESVEPLLGETAAVGGTPRASRTEGRGEPARHA